MESMEFRGVRTRIDKLHKTVWKFREAYGEYWATPDHDDSLAYVLTEAAEALDQDLRLTRPGDARNNDRGGGEGVLDELADTAIMLVTALGPDACPIGGSDPPFPRYYILSLLASDRPARIVAAMVGQLYARGRLGIRNNVHQAEIVTILGLIAKYDPDIVKRAEGRLARIYRKHVKAHVNGVPPALPFLE